MGRPHARGTCVRRRRRALSTAEGSMPIVARPWQPQALSGATRCYQVLSGAIKCHQVLPSAIKSHQVPSSATSILGHRPPVFGRVAAAGLCRVRPLSLICARVVPHRGGEEGGRRVRTPRERHLIIPQQHAPRGEMAARLRGGASKRRALGNYAPEWPEGTHPSTGLYEGSEGPVAQASNGLGTCSCARRASPIPSA